MAIETSTAPAALSFPRETFAKLSPRPFLVAHLKPASTKAEATRPSGRRTSQTRAPTVNTGSLTHSAGSAVVRVGDTAVVCGVRPEILYARDIPRPYTDSTSSDPDGSAEIEELSLLVPNLELSTGCSPQHLPGNAPSTLAQSLSHRLLSLLHISKLVDARDLRIQYQEPATDEDTPDVPAPTVTKAYWTLYIDILFISLDGNPFDAAWAAILAALKDVRLPNAWWDPDRDMILCSDEPAQSHTLSLRGLPIACTFALFSTATSQKPRSKWQSWTLVDPDAFEEELCSGTTTVVVKEREGGAPILLRIESHGATLDALRVREVVARAEQRCAEWGQVLTQDKR